MVAFNKFDSYVDDLSKGKINLSSDVLKVMLSNVLPVRTNKVKADITEITAGNGYSAGGMSTTLTVSNAAGVEKVVGTNAVLTGTGAVGPFRYAVLYDVTANAAAGSLIGWYDNGSTVSLVNPGDLFTVAFDGTNGIYQLA